MPCLPRYMRENSADSRRRKYWSKTKRGSRPRDWCQKLQQVSRTENQSMGRGSGRRIEIEGHVKLKRSTQGTVVFSRMGQENRVSRIGERKARGQKGMTIGGRSLAKKTLNRWPSPSSLRAWHSHKRKKTSHCGAAREDEKDQ